MRVMTLTGHPLFRPARHCGTGDCGVMFAAIRPGRSR